MKTQKAVATIFSLTCMTILLLGSANAEAAKDSPKREKEIQKKVAALVAKMTLEEKVGEMTQVTADLVSKKVGAGHEHEIDQALLEDAILKHHVGSILNVGSTPEYDDAAFSLAHWQDVITQIENVATKKSRLKIPVIYGIDSIHGAQYTKGATIFPQAIAVAASWNPEIARKAGEITALETRASGIPWNFYPVLDIGRQPMWPRFWETFGEDPYLASAMGAANISGQQDSDVNVASCMKHYIGYSLPTTGKDRTPALITERMMREFFLPTFEAAVKAGAETVMVNSGEVDGIPGHANYHMLTEVLRGELKFKGFAVSDWEDIKRLYSRDHVAKSPEEAVQMAVMAGVDMSMVPFDYSFADILVKLVREKKVPMKRINEAVSRILRVKYLFGLFDNAYPDKKLTDKFASVPSATANRFAAEEVITLLKNDGKVLPLSKQAKVFLTGPGAESRAMLNGGWTLTWQGDKEELYPQDKRTIRQAIEEKIGKENLTYEPGTSVDKEIDIEKAVNAAKQADVTIISLGEKTYTETLGNIDDMTMNEPQLRLVEAILKTGKPVVIVLTEGRPRIIHRITGAKAIVMAYLPGMEGASAIAGVLFGDVNPSGKLPFSYPRATGDFTLYDHKYAEELNGNEYKPEFPFGFGLSYTTFAYSDLKLEKTSVTRKQLAGGLRVTVTVRNTGDRAGKEVVQLYLSELYRSVSPPVRQLKGFKKVLLRPGQSQEITFQLTPKELEFIGRANKKTIESGEFEVSVDKLKTKFILQ
jgi:beta-glucosidase